VPLATIKLYISTYLNTYILRAIDDDAASILSVSFGGAGMALNNSVWEQAAAQGKQSWWPAAISEPARLAQALVSSTRLLVSRSLGWNTYIHRRPCCVIQTSHFTNRIRQFWPP
jgi:hypothetical protein